MEINLEKEAALVETVLFLEADPIDEAGISRATGLAVDVVEAALELLAEEYRNNIHGLEPVRSGGGWILAPKLELWDALKDRYGKKSDSRLSRAALETLSIVAYSQPITRPEVEAIRGVSADGMMRFLLEKGFIKEVGKKDAPGKPVQYGTTKDFLKYFRLGSIADLPKLDDLDRDRFSREEEEEDGEERDHPAREEWNMPKPRPQPEAQPLAQPLADAVPAPEASIADKAEPQASAPQDTPPEAAGEENPAGTPESQTETAIVAEAEPEQRN
jgi:segregation and condensation protein B